MFSRFFSRIKQDGQFYGQPAFDWVNNRTGGVPGLVAEAVRSYARAGGSEAAAAMTFYAMFSLFPLLAILVTLGSLAIGENRITIFLIEILAPAFPASEGFILQNISRFYAQRGAFTLLGGVGLFWAASGVFAVMTHHINKAWENARMRNFLQRRLMGFGLVGGILALMGLSLIASTIFDVFTSIRPDFLQEWLSRASPIIPLLSDIVPLVVTFLIFLFVYRYVPAAPVQISDTVWGALLVTVSWEITSSAFTWYVGSGLAQYEVLYGSIAAIAVLMFWLYLNCIMILVGAHLSATVSRRRLRRSIPSMATAPKER